ncbi:MAG: hypothetical protein GF350_00395 [Chitinivibrionales bacterium]|nr:hypothetical protein [Chitinivibrionales bacterium]
MGSNDSMKKAGKNSKDWDGVSRGSTAGNRIFIFLISVFGLVPAYLLCIPVSIYYVFFHREFAAPISEFRRRLGLKTNPWHIFRHFFSFGSRLIDRTGLYSGRSPGFCESRKLDATIGSALKSDRGVLILSAHIGNWEAGAHSLLERLGRPVHIVMLENERAEMSRAFERIYARRKIHTIPVSGDGLPAIMEIINALRRNEIVCMHGDRLIDQRSEMIPFLGKNAQFPVGPFAVAAITRVQIFPVVIIKNSIKSYVPIPGTPITFEKVTRQNRQQEIHNAMKKYVKFLEKIVHHYPYEWHNFYHFWHNSELKNPQAE